MKVKVRCKRGRAGKGCFAQCNLIQLCGFMVWYCNTAPIDSETVDTYHKMLIRFLKLQEGDGGGAWAKIEYEVTFCYPNIIH